MTFLDPYLNPRYCIDNKKLKEAFRYMEDCNYDFMDYEYLNHDRYHTKRFDMRRSSENDDVQHYNVFTPKPSRITIEKLTYNIFGSHGAAIPMIIVRGYHFLNHVIQNKTQLSEEELLIKHFLEHNLIISFNDSTKTTQGKLNLRGFRSFRNDGTPKLPTKNDPYFRKLSSKSFVNVSLTNSFKDSQFTANELYDHDNFKELFMGFFKNMPNLTLKLNPSRYSKAISKSLLKFIVDNDVKIFYSISSMKPLSLGSGKEGIYKTYSGNGNKLPTILSVKSKISVVVPKNSSNIESIYKNFFLNCNIKTIGELELRDYLCPNELGFNPRHVGDDSIFIGGFCQEFSGRMMLGTHFSLLHPLEQKNIDNLNNLKNLLKDRGMKYNLSNKIKESTNSEKYEYPINATIRILHDPEGLRNQFHNDYSNHVTLEDYIKILKYIVTQKSKGKNIAITHYNYSKNSGILNFNRNNSVENMVDVQRDLSELFGPNTIDINSYKDFYNELTESWQVEKFENVLFNKLNGYQNLTFGGLFRHKIKDFSITIRCDDSKVLNFLKLTSVKISDLKISVTQAEEIYDALTSS